MGNGKNFKKTGEPNRVAPEDTSMRTFFILATLFASAAGHAVAAEHVIGQKSKAFTVSNVEAKVGDDVLFVNDDGVFHNIFSLSDAQSFNLGAYGPGISKKMKLEKVGKIEVECAIHPRMKMVIEVSR